MAEVLHAREFAQHLIDTDTRIAPSVVGAIATALIPRWDLRSELVMQPDGIRVPNLSLHRLLGPFSDEHEHNDVIGAVVTYLDTGRIEEIMDTAQAQVIYDETGGGVGDLSVIIQRKTPPLGMYSRRLFGELLLVEQELVDAGCVQSSNPNITLATTLIL
jgi:hypothetical protein